MEGTRKRVCLLAPSLVFTMDYNNIQRGFTIYLSFLFLSLNHLEAATVPAIYVFGDSLVDVGNNNYLKLSIAKANFPHNGIDFPTNKPTGRFCNGKNPTDFLAEKLGLPNAPPYLSLVSKKENGSFINGVSFASGGAGIFNGTDALFKQSLPLSQQVGFFARVQAELANELGPEGLLHHISKSIFVTCIGSNDFFSLFRESNPTNQDDPQQYVLTMAKEMQVQLNRLYGYGARKFLIIGVGVVGCCPRQRFKSKTGECNTEMNNWAIKYNELLKSTMEELKKTFSDISYSYFETYRVMQDIIQKPDSYGFAEIKSACCGGGEFKAKIPCLPISNYCPNREDHVFWDMWHPTEAAYRVFADNIFDGTLEYATPFNLRQLAAI